ncbi:hypothetical protein QBC39DRAFT_43742 [Podospora conica]|nr:hypothetical protein QBC39DRAFT_43742 [Schizothecium conicum]
MMDNNPEPLGDVELWAEHIFRQLPSNRCFNILVEPSQLTTQWRTLFPPLITRILLPDNWPGRYKRGDSVTATPACSDPNNRNLSRRRALEFGIPPGSTNLKQQNEGRIPQESVQIALDGKSPPPEHHWVYFAFPDVYFRHSGHFELRLDIHIRRENAKDSWLGAVILPFGKTGFQVITGDSPRRQLTDEQARCIRLLRTVDGFEDLPLSPPDITAERGDAQTGNAETDGAEIDAVYATLGPEEGSYLLPE